MVGLDECAPLLDGRRVPYVNLDNAATTPPLRAVVEAVGDLLPLYASVHRGTGYKSRVTTAAYERARETVGAFVGADPDRDVVVFGRHTTDAVNLLARSLDADPDAVVLTTLLEHHSNDLPWRARGRVLHVGARPDGALDLDHLDRLLARHAGRVALLAVTGASNVTGVVPPVHDLAARVHAVGGRILVDAAQLAAHRRIDMLPHDDPRHLDFVALSAHKMYAPFGTGALVGRRDLFGPRPHQPGGGTVRAVTVDGVAWADLPDREEGGSPNVIGAVALADRHDRARRRRLRPDRGPRAPPHRLRHGAAGPYPRGHAPRADRPGHAGHQGRRHPVHRSRAWTRGWWRPCWATSTASACAAAASAPTRTSPTCWR